jgi:transcriptional regulator with GAF, ATPase, and Fis domain
MIVAVISFVLSFASLLDSVITGKIKYSGWNIAFILILFISAMILFYLVYMFTDEKLAAGERKKAFEEGKAEILNELEKRNRVENEAKSTGEEDIEKMVSLIMTGIKSGRSTKTGNRILANLAKHLEFVQGILYLKEKDGLFNPEGEYALTGQTPAAFRSGEGLAGQVAESLTPMVLYDIPEQYFTVESALGSSKPRFLVIAPLVIDNECYGVIELSAFKKPDDNTGKILQKLSDELGPILHTSFAA